MHSKMTLNGKSYVVIEVGEFRRLTAGAHQALPPLPKEDERGNRPAVAYARAVIARDIIRDRESVGLYQKDLAKLAGIRVETLNRIEKCRTTPDTATLVKIDRALERAKAQAEGNRREKPVKTKRAAASRKRHGGRTNEGTPASAPAGSRPKAKARV